MTPKRYQRIRTVLERRQTDLTVCTDNVLKPHNISAILRTCDAAGIHHLHVVLDTTGSIRMNTVRRGRNATEPSRTETVRSGTTKGSHLWVNRHNHSTIDTAFNTFDQQNMQILVTHLSDDAVDFREIDYTKPTAIVLGNEKHGVSQQAIARSHHRITIPMLGMVQSLNVSVAGALVAYEAQRQRENAGLYERKMLSEQEIQKILFERGHTRLCEYCKSKGLPYPQIGVQGEVVADERWWKEMQLTPEALAAIDKDDDNVDLNIRD